MKPISFLHNSSAGLAHPAQPHVAEPEVFFEKPERLAACIEVAKRFQGAGVTVEAWESLADAHTLQLVHPPDFLDAFERACRESGATVREFGREFFVGPPFLRCS